MPIVGVLVPEAHAAVQATRNRRIGLLATEATVASGRYEEVVHALDAGAQVVSVACPKLVPLIEAGRRRRGARRGRARVRGAAQGGGRRHGHPRLHALPDDPARLRARRSAAGRRSSSPPTRPRARWPRRSRARASRTTSGRDGSTRFLTTGAPEEFQALGERFLQLPIPQRRAGHRPRARARARVSLRRHSLLARGTPAHHPLPSVQPKSARVARGPCRERDGMSREGRRPDELRPVEIVTGLRRAGDRLGAHLLRRHAGPLHGERRGGRAALARRQRARAG